MANITGLYEVSINGSNFRVVQEQYARRFLDVVRQQADSGQEPSEFSLNPNDLWRRSQSSWKHGAGQHLFDDTNGLRTRYDTSTNLDPFCGCEMGEMKLARATSRIDSLGATLDYREAATCPDTIYVRSEGENTLEVFDTTQSTTAATPDANPIVSIAAIGSEVYAATNDGAGAGSIYSYDGSWTLVTSLTADRIAYVKGRLIAIAGPSVYNIIELTTTTPPAALNPEILDENFEWTAIGESDGFILLAGRSGEKSHLYRTAIGEDGQALDVPVFVTQLPDGEFVRAMTTYLGTTTLATNEGVRVGIFQGTQFQYGPRVYEGTDVWDLEPQDKFIYFTRDGGLGRINLSQFLPNFDLAPAYALDVSTTFNLPVYAVASRPSGVTLGDGEDYSIFFIQDTDGTTTDGGVFEVDDAAYASSGTFTTGDISFGMADTKNFMFLEVAMEIEGSGDQVQVYKIPHNGSASLIGVIEGVNDTRTFFVDESAESISFRFVLLSGDQASQLTSPILRRWTLRALPVPKRTEQIVVPLDLRKAALGLNGGTAGFNVWEEFEALQAYVRSGEIVEYQEFDNAYLASVENVQLGPDLDVTVGDDGWEGIVLVTLRIYDDTIVSEVVAGVDETTSMFGIGEFGSGTFGGRS